MVLVTGKEDDLVPLRKRSNDVGCLCSAAGIEPIEELQTSFERAVRGKEKDIVF